MAAWNLSNYFIHRFIQGKTRSIASYTSSAIGFCIRETPNSPKVHAVLKGITKGICSSTEQPVPSLLSPSSFVGGSKEKAKVKQPKVQAVLKGIKQSPKKVNLVAALVRGMQVEDALMQLQVTVKRAAKTLYQVIHSARANAAHNHGFDPNRLIVAEAFVGKGRYLKRMSYHSKGRSGIKVRPKCRLTVVLRETSPEEEAEIARLKVYKCRKVTKREQRLVPHKLIEKAPIWARKPKSMHPSVAD